MKERKLKIFFSKNSRGSLTPKTTLPNEFVKFIGITEEEREIVVKLDEKNKTIVIAKKD